MLNIATCFYKMQQYEKAAELCSKIVEEEDGKLCVKAYYKKACSQIGATHFLEARYSLLYQRKTAIEGLKCLKIESGEGGQSIRRQDFLKLVS
jgi:hypothetical protein